MLTRERFAEFMQAATGHKPFAWQVRALDCLLDSGEWPGVISAPTGSGKSSVVYIHVFAVALNAVGEAPRLPRRLAVVVNRRAIVDAHEQRAAELQSALDTGIGILAEVAEALSKLSLRRLLVTNLRGGISPSAEWLMDPLVCQIICATPDMLGSRLLFRGYGSSRLARPREAGLLAFDTALVLDEAHLNVQLLQTARQVAQLVSRSPKQVGLPILQVVETTATPSAANRELVRVGVEVADLAAEPTLHARLCRPKPVREVKLSGCGAKKASVGYLNDLAGIVADLSGQNPGTVGCVVNHVDTAVRLTQLLRQRGMRVECWVGRLRPMDLTRMMARHPGMFTVEGDPSVDVLVATQTAEVGVDIDFGALVTELAPGSSLGQRAGRTNRLGIRPSGPVVVIGPIDGARDNPPYNREELEESSAWVERLAGSECGMSPWALTADPPPAAALRRTALHRIELADGDYLARTSQPLFADPDLALWLRDDLEEDQATCGLVVRSGLGSDLVAFPLLNATPPNVRETFPVPIGLVLGIMERVFGAGSPSARAFIWRDDELTLIGAVGDYSPKPGDVIVLDDAHKLVRSGVVVPDPDEVVTETAWGAEGVHVVWPHDQRFAPIPGIDWVGVFEELESLDAEAALVAFHEATGLRDYQIELPPVPEGDPLPWIVLRRGDEVDDVLRQTWTPSRGLVTLEAHEEAVAERAARIGAALGLPDSLVEILRLAGLLHDEGKQDDRFQFALGRRADDPPLAKSRFRSIQQARRIRAKSGLPMGWRHEQLSVLYAAEAVQSMDADTADVVMRLVGTSHGHGRGVFNQSGQMLVAEPCPDLAEEYFDTGRWDELIERTHDAWGVWGCAVLEAILRAADGQVSAEGS